MAVSKALVRSLLCTSEDEAIDLLLRSNRVRMDLGQDVAYPKFFKSSLVVRRYDVDIDPALEFRAFVRNHKLTAVSQYEEFYYPNLSSRQEELKSRIADFFTSVVSPIVQKTNCLPASYVVDFALIGESLKVIEINPFHSNTAGSLFSWKNDRETILNGPLSFRFVESPPKKPLELVPPHLLKDIQNFYRRKSAVSWVFGAILVCVVAAQTALWLKSSGK